MDVILNGLQAAKDLACIVTDLPLQEHCHENERGPASCAAARRILHPAEAGVQDDAILE